MGPDDPRGDGSTDVKERECGRILSFGHSSEGQSDISELAESRIHRDEHFSEPSISCSYHEGVLILRGRVPTYYLKQIAQTVAMQMDGVQQVDNRIEVRN